MRGLRSNRPVSSSTVPSAAIEPSSIMSRRSASRIISSIECVIYKIGILNSSRFPTRQLLVWSRDDKGSSITKILDGRGLLCPIVLRFATRKTVGSSIKKVCQPKPTTSVIDRGCDSSLLKRVPNNRLSLTVMCGNSEPPEKHSRYPDFQVLINSFLRTKISWFSIL